MRVMGPCNLTWRVLSYDAENPSCALSIPTIAKMTNRSMLIAGELEVALDCALRPGALQRAVVGADVFQLARGGDMAVLGIGFYADGPVRHVYENACERDGIGTGVDLA